MNDTNQNKTQMADPSGEATQMVTKPDAGATQYAVNVDCPVCKTPNSPSETYCIDCGFLLSGTAPVAIEDMPKVVDAGKLVSADGTREFILRSGENTIGRENADVLLTDNTVSRSHAKLVADENGVTLLDLGSTNGTFVDGERIADNEPILIADGAELMFGSVVLKYVAPLAPPEESGEKVSEESPDESGEETTILDSALTDEICEESTEDVEETKPPSLMLVSRDEMFRFSLVQGLNTVGRRDGANTVVIQDSYVSGRHADINVVGNELTITDVGSTNGTLVNGVKIEANSPKEAREGDEIAIGQQVFKIEVG